MAVVSMKQLIGSRRTFRSSDPPLEPEDGEVHLHRTQRHLYHRPAEDRRESWMKLTVSCATWQPKAAAILFVGTKKQAQESIEQEAKRCNMFYVNERVGWAAC